MIRTGCLLEAEVDAACVLRALSNGDRNGEDNGDRLRLAGCWADMAVESERSAKSLADSIETKALDGNVFRLAKNPAAARARASFCSLRVFLGVVASAAKALELFLLPDSFRTIVSGTSGATGVGVPSFWEETYCTLRNDFDRVEKLLCCRMLLSLRSTPPLPGDEFRLSL